MKYQRYYDEKLRHFKPWWKDIRKCWNDFSFRRAIQLKNGKRTKFWWDMWVGENQLKEAFLFLYRPASSKHFIVVNLWERGGSRCHITALRAVKKRLIDPMKNIRNWGKGDPCTSKWKGIICKDKNTTDGYLHVNALLLLKMNLSGTLAPELGQLSHLEIIDFLWNDLSGSIPKEIGNIAPLRLL
ncbi:putative leucine-rich repeat receptor-like serine/threonine-protein kinase [Vitis vinifera]|uniref:Putative leucine-rich repeat receptor-like serine/threonine-protein kinase n=1 Tax=Vitis vinifera TaxID=29760 RepID=A0A438D4N3_VITVI|nr:putative leucine-rich repeat receptor-like serine/threonine-protein kinase [Vitis vinifera]